MALRKSPFPSMSRAKVVALIVALATAVSLSIQSAAAVAFRTNGDTVSYPEKVNGTVTSCPTFASAPEPYEVFLNTDDSEARGWWDPKNNQPWSFASRIAQFVCGAKQNASIRIGMYFIRAIGTASRPEADPEVIFNALEWVKKNRNVNIELVLDDGLAKGSTRDQITQRFAGIAKVSYCVNGCFNVNKSSVYIYAINHEKFLTISDTVWDSSAGLHPLVLSTSGNFSRGQIRNYWQEASAIYDDYKLWKEFDLRYRGMAQCASPGCSSGGSAITALQLSKQRNIWVDPFYRRYTDSGRGTSVSFSPQTPSAPDYYISQFDGIDCTVDKQVRIAMFKLTDSKALRLAQALARLKNAGCDVQMLLSQSYGALVLASSVKSVLKSAKIPYRCSAIPMHTKMILIGPSSSNEGRVLVGTANMSTSGLRYSDEHVITLDTRRASLQYQESMRRAYGLYLEGFDQLSQWSRSC